MSAKEDAKARGHDLDGFCLDRVLLSEEEAWRRGRDFLLVKRGLEKVAQWAYEASRGLFLGAPLLPVGSYCEGLHLQVAGRPNDLNFLIPVRYNPLVLLVSGPLPQGSPLGCKEKLPTYIFREKGLSQGLPLFRWGTKVLVDLEAFGETHVEIHCHKQKERVMEDQEEEEEEEDLELDQLEQCEESLEHHNLDPVQILKDFHRCVEIALDPEFTHPRQNDEVFRHRLFPSRVPKIDHKMRESFRLEPLDLDGPAIELAFNGGNETVPVKLVPAIKGTFILSNQWVREDLTHLSDWWDGDLANEKSSFLRKAAVVREVGPELVPKGVFWRLSFSHAETVILEDVDTDGGQRWVALKLLKFVNMTRWMPEYGSILTSYHLKTILLWCCEIYPQKAQWETILSSVQALLRLLIHTLTKRNLPHYFLASVNLYSRHYKSGNTIYRPLGLDALRHEAEVMLADTVRYLMPDCEPQHDGIYDETMAALVEFKENHKEELKELKRMEDEHMYESVEIAEAVAAKS